MLTYIYSFFYKLSKKSSRENLYEFLEQKIEELSNAGHNQEIINIGSGGEVYNKIQKLETSCNIRQVDVDSDRKPDIVASACNMKVIDDSSIDAVFLIEVLEHINEPKKALKEIHRILKPNGKLILSTPFIFPIHDEPYDFYRYTEYGLQYLLKDFDNVKITPRNNSIKSIYVLFGRMLIGGDKKNNLVGLLLYAYMLLQLPVFYIFSKFYSNNRLTTGYTISAEKI